MRYAENHKIECSFRLLEASNDERFLETVKCNIFKSYSFDEGYSAAPEIRLEIEKENVVRNESFIES